VNGQRSTLSPSDIAQAGLAGVAQSGDMVSKYLIERAEQYQPVVEMPTGLDVEVVFLDGVFIRN
jgi:conjugal transfer pilus assembly protein TraB